MSNFVKIELVNEQFQTGTKGAWLQNNRTIEIFLQRQGCAVSFYCYHPEFDIELMTWQQTDNYSLKVNNRHFIMYDFQDALKFIPEALASAGVKRKVIVNPQIMDYMYGMDMYPHQSTDKILSPFFYCEYSDTIRTCMGNYCLVTFNDNCGFNSYTYVTDFHEDATRHIGNIENALRTGFHQCDRKRGADYCKRRLAWLAGQNAITEFEGNISLAFVNKDMTRIKRA